MGRRCCVVGVTVAPLLATVGTGGRRLGTGRVVALQVRAARVVDATLKNIKIQ